MTSTWRARLWPLLRTFYPSTTVGGLEIVDVGLMAESMPEVQRLFAEALGYVDAAGSDFSDLLSQNLRRVAIVRPGYERIAVTEGKYGTTLEGHEGQNAFCLALRLIWVAEYVRLVRSGQGSELAERALRDQSFTAATDFAARFPDGAEWIGYVEKSKILDWGNCWVNRVLAAGLIYDHTRWYSTGSSRVDQQAREQYLKDYGQRLLNFQHATRLPYPPFEVYDESFRLKTDSA